MSGMTVSYVHLVCDGCGAVRAEAVHGITAARLAAAQNGWKYTDYDVRGLNIYGKRDNFADQRKRMKIVPRSWDACPDCPLPANANEAHAIRIARQEQP